MELIFQASYVSETAQNRTEFFSGAPVLYFYTNQKPAQQPQRISHTETRNGELFTVRIRIVGTLETYAHSEFIIGVSAFSVTRTKQNRVGFIHAGSVAFSVQTLLTVAAREGTFAIPLAITHGMPRPVRKGLLHIAHQNMRTTGNVGLIKQQRIETQFVHMFTSVGAQLSAYVQHAYRVLDRTDGGGIPPAFSLSRNIRATVWQTAAGPLPFAAFWSLRNRFSLSEHYWLHLLHTVLDRYDLTQHVFTRTLRSIHEWTRETGERMQGDSEDRAFELMNMRDQVRRVGSILANMLTAFANTLPYLTDKFVTREGRAVLIDMFDKIRQRLCGDCEDDGTDIFKLFAEFTAKTTTFTAPSLQALQGFARAYVCAGVLGAVTTGRLYSSTGDPTNPTRENTSKYAAHIWAVLVPATTWAEWRYGPFSPEVKYTRTHAPTWARAFGEILACEGTGHMDPVVGSRNAPRVSKTTQRAAEAAQLFFRRHPGLIGLAHTSGLVDAYGGFSSPFYRQCMFAWATVLDLGNNTWSEFVEELYFVDSASVRHGVTFDALTRYEHGSGSLQIRPLAPMPQRLREATIAVLENSCPDPTLVVPSAPIAHPFAHNLIGEKLVSQRPNNTTALHLWVPLDTLKSLFDPASRQGVPNRVRREIERALHSDRSLVKSARYRYEAFDTHVVQLRITLYLATTNNA